MIHSIPVGVRGADTDEQSEQTNVGGYEVYMAADDDEDNDEKATGESSHTGAGQRRKADPAELRPAAGDELPMKASDPKGASSRTTPLPPA